LSKPVTVISNDSRNPKMVLRITGRVQTFVRVEPERVTLTGRVGEPISRTVLITPETNELFEVVRVHALRGTEIAYELETIETDGKKTYALHVRNNKQNAGRYYDKIFLTINSDVVDSIPIIISGNIQPGTEEKQ